MIKKAFVLAGMAAAVLAWGPTTSWAHTEGYASDVEIGFADYEPPTFPEDPPDHFEGWVHSSKGRCEPRRTVTVLRRVDGPDVVIGTDRSEDDGFNPDAFWAIPPREDPANGFYYARVRPRTIKKSPRHKHVCASAVSSGLWVENQ